jgi:hypothetical protein
VVLDVDVDPDKKITAMFSASGDHWSALYNDPHWSRRAQEAPDEAEGDDETP